MGDFEKNVQGQETLFNIGDLPKAQQMELEKLAAWLNDLMVKVNVETVRKAGEYGAADLAVMAKAMLALVPEHKRDESLGLEMALGFYLLGKVARLFGAFERGDRPSADTWYDAMVYSMMALKVRETGRWV